MVLLTTGSLLEAILLVPALTQKPTPLDTVKSNYLIFLYEKVGIPYIASFRKYFKCVFYNNQEYVLEWHIFIQLKKKKAESLIQLTMWCSLDYSLNACMLVA